MNDKEKLLEQVNRSGFPLQLAVEHAVNNHSGHNGWKIYSQEHSWKNPSSGTSGFIDLVLIDQHQLSMMVVECKRVQNTQWIFLSNDSKQMRRRHCKPWITYIEEDKAKKFDWANLAIDPTSPESSFCVVAGQDPKSRPMLERLAAEANEATEAFAREDLAMLLGNNGDLRIYYNVIVTSAELVVCEMMSNAISLASGSVDEASFTTVPYVRFRKQLSVNRTVDPSTRNYVSLFREKENTVFVVNSTHLLDFLNKYDVEGSSIRGAINAMR
ncbi:MAG: hypothetical protein AB2697_19825 [Candidatus Thiodiazotropha endolucinida]